MLSIGEGEKGQFGLVLFINKGSLMNSLSTYHPPTLLQQRVPHRTIALQALHIPFAAPVAAFSVATATCSFVLFEASFDIQNRGYI